MSNLKSAREDRALDLNEKLYKSFSSNGKGAGDMAAYPALRKKLHWLSTGMSIEKNRVVVFLANLSAKNLTGFKHQVSDSPMLIFEEMKVEE